MKVSSVKDNNLVIVNHGNDFNDCRNLLITELKNLANSREAKKKVNKATNKVVLNDILNNIKPRTTNTI